MARLRKHIAPLQVDRDIAARVEAATKLIRDALVMVRIQRRGADVSKARFARVQRDLEGCLGALGDVRRVSSSFSEGDAEVAPAPVAPVLPPPAPPVEDVE